MIYLLILYGNQWLFTMIAGVYGTGVRCKHPPLHLPSWCPAIYLRRYDNNTSHHIRTYMTYSVIIMDGECILLHLSACMHTVPKRLRGKSTVP